MPQYHTPSRPLAYFSTQSPNTQAHSHGASKYTAPCSSPSPLFWTRNGSPSTIKKRFPAAIAPIRTNITWGRLCFDAISNSAIPYVLERNVSATVSTAKSGIAAAVVLGVGRAIGEATAVMMVAGNASNMPGLFQSVRFLTTAIVSEMAYSGGLQRQALFSIALVLYLFILLVNAALNFFLKRDKGA